MHRKNLHSTMFLLIPLMKNGTFSGLGKFTFHNVSINTMDRIFEDMLRFYLHSTMFLLIRIRHGRDSTGSRFTFHNVSINTNHVLPSCRKLELDLHSTMFLLIQHFSI